MNVCMNNVYSIHIILLCACIGGSGIHCTNNMNIINACLYTIPWSGQKDRTRPQTFTHACLYASMHFLPAFNMNGCEKLYIDPSMVIFSITLVFTSPHVIIGLGAMVTLVILGSGHCPFTTQGKKDGTYK